MNTTATAREIAEKLRDILHEKFSDFSGLYLFGSQAKGTAACDSDIDIVVLMKTWSWKETSDFYKVISRFRYENDVDLDLLPMTRGELERNPFFYDEVVNKGIFYVV